MPIELAFPSWGQTGMPPPGDYCSSPPEQLNGSCAAFSLRLVRKDILSIPFPWNPPFHRGIGVQKWHACAPTLVDPTQRDRNLTLSMRQESSDLRLRHAPLASFADRSSRPAPNTALVPLVGLISTNLEKSGLSLEMALLNSPDSSDRPFSVIAYNPFEWSLLVISAAHRSWANIGRVPALSIGHISSIITSKRGPPPLRYDLESMHSTSTFKLSRSNSIRATWRILRSSSMPTMATSGYTSRHWRATDAPASPSIRILWIRRTQRKLLAVRASQIEPVNILSG